MDNFNLKKFLKEGTLLKEVDSSVLGGIAKNLYTTLSKMPVNNPVDKDGERLLNDKGNEIEHSSKVKMAYHPQRLDPKKEYSKSSKSKYLGTKGYPEVSISYHGIFLDALGFVEEKEADKALADIEKEYPNVVNAEVVEHDISKTHDWAKHYAPTYSIKMDLKTDQEVARGQSERPAVGENLDRVKLAPQDKKAIKEDDSSDYAYPKEGLTEREIMEKIFSIIEDYELDPSTVLEIIGQEYGIDFEFGSDERNA